MLNYEDHFSTIKQFIKSHESLIDCHLVDFLTKNLWDKCLPVDLRNYIEENECNVMNDFMNSDDASEHSDSEIHAFLRQTKSLKLENCDFVIKRDNFLNIIDHEKSGCSKATKSEFMKVKKWHEVDVFTKTIAWLNEGRSSVVIDAGAGKGYSSLHLTNEYDLPVLAIECSQTNHEGAILRRDLVNKKSKKSTSMIQYAVEQINEETDFLELVKAHFPELKGERELVMTALHACGSLTDSVIKSFLNVSDIKCLCIVPCCYHLASNSLSSVYEFSKNSRMLAQQSTDRTRQKCEPLSPSLFYRAVLQVILRSSGIENARIGRGAPLDDFVTYAKWALHKLGKVEIPSDVELDKIYREYKHIKWKFDVFQLLRIHLAPVIEAAIILDKVVYMHRSKVCQRLQLVQLFDPLTSPRSWAIIATK